MTIPQIKSKFIRRKASLRGKLSVKCRPSNTSRKSGYRLKAVLT